MEDYAEHGILMEGKEKILVTIIYEDVLSTMQYFKLL